MPDPVIFLVTSMAAGALAFLSSVAGFGGGVLLLPVLVALFGVQVAVPVLTLAQLSSNASRTWLNRREIRAGLVWRFVVGAAPFVALGAALLTSAPLAPLKRLLGIFLIALVVWRRVRPASKRRPCDRTFFAVGAASGLGSALLGSVGPLTAPFFLAYGLVRGAYIGTEAASALALHLTKVAAYGAGDLLSLRVLALGAALTPATLAGAWLGKRATDQLSPAVFVRLVEAGLLVAGVLLLVT